MRVLQAIWELAVVAAPSYLLGRDYGFSIGFAYFIAICFVVSMVHGIQGLKMAIAKLER